MSNFDPYYQWLGISKEDQPASHYRILGLREGETDLEVIENAADRQMVFLRQHAAGKHGSHATKLLNQVTRARLVLLSPEMKSAYDRGLQITEPKITSKPPKPIGSSAPVAATSEKRPAEKIAEQPVESVPIVETTPKSSAISKDSRGRAAGSRNQWAKKNKHWIVAGTGGLIVGLILLSIILSNILSASDKPALADGPTNKPSVSKPSSVSRPFGSNMPRTTSDQRDNDNSNPGGATSHGPTTTAVVKDPSPVATTTVVASAPVITNVIKSPTDDTYVRGGNYAKENYGDENVLMTKENANPSYIRNAYLRFEIPAGQIDSAILKLTPTSIGDCKDRSTALHVQLLPDTQDNWPEDTVTWNERLTAGGPEITITRSMFTLNESAQINVTSLFADAPPGNNIVTFRLYVSGTGGDCRLDFASKEHENAFYRPTLTIKGGG